MDIEDVYTYQIINKYTYMNKKLKKIGSLVEIKVSSFFHLHIPYSQVMHHPFTPRCFAHRPRTIESVPLEPDPLGICQPPHLTYLFVCLIVCLIVLFVLFCFVWLCFVMSCYVLLCFFFCCCRCCCCCCWRRWWQPQIQHQLDSGGRTSIVSVIG